MRIPDQRLLLTLWASLWISRFVLVPVYFVHTQELNYYPVDADSIGIPIIGNLVATVIGAPFFVLYLLSVFRDSPPQSRSWFAWSRSHPVKSLCWSLLYGFFAYACLEAFIESIHIHLPAHAFADALWCFLWLAIRGITVSKLCSPSDTMHPLPERA